MRFVRGEDGFEARLQQHTLFEPELVVRQGRILVDFAAMVTMVARTAKNLERVQEAHHGNGSKVEGDQEVCRTYMNSAHNLSPGRSASDCQTRGCGGHECCCDVNCSNG